MFLNSFVVLFFLFINIAIPICIGIYVYQDAKSRGMEAILWTAVAVLVPYFIGLIIYLIVRYNRSTHRCNRCEASVKDTYTLCPQCGAALKEACPSCGAYVEPHWRMCAHCGTELPHDVPYDTYENNTSSGFNSGILLKGLIIAAVITIIIAVFFLIQIAAPLGGMVHMHGVNFMRHL